MCNKYRIVSRLQNGASSQTEYLMTLQVAKLVMRGLREKHPDARFFLEPAECRCINTIPVDSSAPISIPRRREHYHHRNLLDMLL